MQTVLIFGATGTIGAYAALHLKELGYRVLASGLRETDNGFFAEHDIPYYSVDIRKIEDFAALEEISPDAVLFCAAVMPAVMRGYNPQTYIDVIMTGGLNVLEYMREKEVSKIIYTQTRADSNHLMGRSEKVPSDIVRSFPPKGDHSVYAICKNAAVDLIEHYFFQHGIKRFVLRLPTIYAYHPNPNFYVDGKLKPIAYRLIIEKALKGEPVEIWGDPSKAKEITYIGDLCQIIQKAIASPLDGGIYNVGRGIGVSLEEQITGIVKEFSPSDRTSEIIYRPDMPSGRQFVHDISKTRVELGYAPEYDYTRLLEAYREEMECERFAKLWGRGDDYKIQNGM